MNGKESGVDRLTRISEEMGLYDDTTEKRGFRQDDIRLEVIRRNLELGHGGQEADSAKFLVALIDQQREELRVLRRGADATRERLSEDLRTLTEDFARCITERDRLREDFDNLYADRDEVIKAWSALREELREHQDLAESNNNFHRELATMLGWKEGDAEWGTGKIYQAVAAKAKQGVRDTCPGCGQVRHERDGCLCEIAMDCHDTPTV